MSSPSGQRNPHLRGDIEDELWATGTDRVTIRTAGKACKAGKRELGLLVMQGQWRGVGRGREAKPGTRRAGFLSQDGCTAFPLWHMRASRAEG